MPDKQSELERLRARLAHLEAHTQRELESLRQAIDALAGHDTDAATDRTSGPTNDPTSDPTSGATPARDFAPAEAALAGAALWVANDAQTPANAAPELASEQANVRVEDFTLYDEDPTAGGRTGAPEPRSAPAEPGVVDVFLDRARKAILSLLGPLGAIVDQALGAYAHYRDAGKGPTFLLTVAGLIAMTAGFGYLLQYSFNNFLGPASKLGLGALLGGAIVGGGIWLHARRPTMTDYASSILALGVIVLNLCAYFAGPYYGLVPDALNFGLFAAIAALAYFLALRYETRVVAVVTLLGGVIGPLLVTGPVITTVTGLDGTADPLVVTGITTLSNAYVAFVGLMTVGACHLSRRLSWPLLLQLTFATTVGALEFAVVEHLATGWLVAAIGTVHLVAFGYGLLFDRPGVMRTPTASTLTLLTAEVIFFVALSVQVISNSTHLGLFLCAVAIGTAIPFFAPFAASAKARPAFLAAAGVFLGCGLLALVGLDYLGMVWGIEALALVYLGNRFHTSTLRYEGLGLFVLTLGAVTWTGLEWAFLGQWDVAPGWLTVVAMVLYLEVLGRFLRVASETDQFPPRFFWLSDELEAAVGAFAWLGLALVIEPQWIGVQALIPLFALLYFASKRQLVIAQWIAFSHLVLPIGHILFAGFDAGTFRFGLQPLLAQIARVEVFISLWLFQAFYERFYPESRVCRWSRPIRQVFYLLVPLIFLPKVARDFPEHFSLALWGSAVIAWGLFRAVRTAPLRFELIALTLGAATITLLGGILGELDIVEQSTLHPLVVGVVFFVLFAKIEAPIAPLDVHHLRLILLGAGFYFGGVLAALAHGVSGSVALGAAVAALYFFGNAAGFFRASYLLAITTVSYLLAVVASVIAVSINYATADALLYVVISTALAVAGWGYGLHSERPDAVSARARLGDETTQHWLWHALIVGAYVVVAEHALGTSFGPTTSVLLVVHAAAVLFRTLTPRWASLGRLALALFVIAGIKTVFYDMADFSIIEKIIALIVIGGVLLGSAYWFQVLGDKRKTTPADEEPLSAGSGGEATPSSEQPHQEP